MKLVEVFVAGVVVGLAVSWTYILSLKATIRICRTYIEDRIRNRTDRFERNDESIQEELGGVRNERDSGSGGQR